MSNISLHAHQTDAIETAVVDYNAKTPRLMIVSPTGTGKSYIAKGILDAIPGSVFVAPTQEILNDMAAKGVPTNRMYTIKKLHNILMAGKELDIPAVVIDEAHHAIDNTHQTVIALLPARTMLIGLTATPYRGTPQSSAELQLFWGKIYTALTYTVAAQSGLIRIPICHTIPLVDDDVLTSAAGGDFNITATTSVYRLKTDDAANILLRLGWVDVPPIEPLHPENKIVAPTIVGVCGSEQALYMVEAIERVCGVEARVVSAETDYKTRASIFRDVVACKCVLVHINVVSEGVDLPIRYYLDLAPTLSPRLWVQRIGRQMRPHVKGTAVAYPEYACTNRNLERHAYLLEGCIPDAYVATAQQAFPTPSGRSARRAIGLESLGKLRADTVRLTSGLTCTFYNVQGRHANGTDRVAYICLLHPCKSEIVWLHRLDTLSQTPNVHGGKQYTYGKWTACTPPADGAFTGYGAAPAKPLTPGQSNWWARSAKDFGLDPAQEVTNRRFAVLPALSDIGATL